MTVQDAKTIFEELLTVPKEMVIKYDSVTDDVQKKKLNDIYLAEQIAIECMQEVEQYRALGTIDGFKKALDGCVEYYNQMKEYKVKLSEYEALGTVEELKEAMEKQPKADWIPCEERLPSESGYYLICVQDLAVKDFGFIETWFDLENSEWQRVHVGETVVAWQLIPEFCKKDHLGEVNGIVKEGNSHENT